MISGGSADALERWLAELSAVGGKAANTIEAYRADVVGFLEFLQNHEASALGTAALGRLKTRDMRAWMAHERARGVGARSLARSLSAVKNFVGWLAEREGFDPSAVLMTRAPRFKKVAPSARRVGGAGHAGYRRSSVDHGLGGETRCCGCHIALWMWSADFGGDWADRSSSPNRIGASHCWQRR